MERENVPDKFTHAVEGLRDRAAGAVSSDRGSVFREMASLARRVDVAEERIGERIEGLEDTLGGRLRDLSRAESRTTWPRRLFWLLVGAGVGSAASFLGDPDRGTARRSRLNDQAGSRAREASKQLQQRAKMTANKVRGQAIEGVKDRLPDYAETDPALLEQRIKSQVFGHRDDVQDVVIVIDGPGAVAVKGTVPNADSERELLEQVSEVDGVIDVRSELSVRA